MQRAWNHVCLRHACRSSVFLRGLSAPYSTTRTTAWVLTNGGIEPTLSALAIAKRLDPGCKVKRLVGSKGKQKSKKRFLWNMIDIKHTHTRIHSTRNIPCYRAKVYGRMERTKVATRYLNRNAILFLVNALP